MSEFIRRRLDGLEAEVEDLLGRGEANQARRRLARMYPLVLWGFAGAQRDQARQLERIADLYLRAGERGAARRVYRRAATILRRDSGVGQTHLVRCLERLAEYERADGDLEEAADLYREVLTIHRRAPAGASPLELAQRLNRLAVVCRQLGADGEALPLLAEALEISRRLLGPLHPSLAILAANLAGACMAVGELSRGEDLYREAVALLRRTVGSDHPQLAHCLADLAELYRLQDRHTAARRCLERAVECFRRGDDLEGLLDSLGRLAVLCRATGDDVKARLLWAEGEEILRRYEEFSNQDKQNAIQGV